MPTDGRIAVAWLWQTVTSKGSDVERLPVAQFEPLSMLYARVEKTMGTDAQLYVSGFGDAIARVVWLPRDNRELFIATLREFIESFHATPSTHFDDDHIAGKRSIWGKAYLPMPYYFWSVTPEVHERHQWITRFNRQFA